MKAATELKTNVKFVDALTGRKPTATNTERMMRACTEMDIGTRTDARTSETCPRTLTQLISLDTCHTPPILLDVHIYTQPSWANIGSLYVCDGATDLHQSPRSLGDGRGRDVDRVGTQNGRLGLRPFTGGEREDPEESPGHRYARQIYRQSST